MKYAVCITINERRRKGRMLLPVREESAQDELARIRSRGADARLVPVRVGGWR